jgi:predicted oxidoreductase
MLGLPGNLAAVALCWLAAHPADILPVMGTTKIAHLDDAIRSLNVKMPRDMFYSILSVAIGHELP